MAMQIPACAMDGPGLGANVDEDEIIEPTVFTQPASDSGRNTSVAVDEELAQAQRQAAAERDATHEELLDMLPEEGRQKVEELAEERASRPDAEVLADEIRDRVESGEFEDDDRASGEVGTLPGSFSVDDSGAAHYSIPLGVPPGRRGMAPSLTLSYSSHGGDGMVGMGWSLSVPPTIHLCDAFMAVRAEESVEMRQRDITVPEAKERLCLGSNPMVVVAGGQGDYGWKQVLYEATDVEFRLVNDSITRIVRPGWPPPLELPDSPEEGLNTTATVFRQKFGGQIRP